MQQALAPDTDLVQLGESVGLGTSVERWQRAIRSVHVRDASRLYVAGHDEHPVRPDQAIDFAREPLFRPNTPHERRFVAMMFEIVGALLPWGRSGYRSCSRQLWRGREHRYVYSHDGGEPDRVYVPKKSQAGLAGRLGCSVRTLTAYVRIARAAGFVDVWQMPKKEAKPGQAGKKYGYAVFSYLLELPQRVRMLLQRKPRDPWPARRETAPTKLRAAAAPAPAAGAGSGAYEGEAVGILEGLRGRARAPT